MRRIIGATAVAVAVVAAVVIQVTVLSRLTLPSATPDLVLVVAAALGAVRGPAVGAVSGFGGGLLLDLAPPADHPAGQWALVLTVVGYAAGRLCDPAASALLRIAVVAALAGAGTLAYAALSAGLGAGWLGAGDLAAVLLASIAYAGLLAVAVLPVTWWAADRLTPRRARW